jgi:hypothetical protein
MHDVESVPTDKMSAEPLDHVVVEDGPDDDLDRLACKLREELSIARQYLAALSIDVAAESAGAHCRG